MLCFSASRDASVKSRISGILESRPDLLGRTHGGTSCRQIEDIVIGPGKEARLRWLDPALEPAERGFDCDFGSIDANPGAVQLIRGD